MKDDQIHDAPKGWEPFEQALKTLPPRKALRERVDTMRVQVIRRTIFGRPRSRVLAGAGGLALAAIAIVTLIGIGTEGHLSPGHLASPMQIVREIPLRHKTAPRATLRRLPSPEAMEMGVDTAIPGNPSNYGGHHPAIPPMPPAATGR